MGLWIIQVPRNHSKFVQNPKIPRRTACTPVLIAVPPFHILKTYRLLCLFRHTLLVDMHSVLYQFL